MRRLLGYISRVARGFARAPFLRKLHLSEALITLLVGRFLTLFPMRYYTRLLGAHLQEGSQETPEPETDRARRLASAVERMAQIVPFKAVCIEQALALRMMLRLRGIGSTSYIGVHKDREQRIDRYGYNCHVWMRVGKRVILGGPNVSQYVPLAVFG